WSDGTAFQASVTLPPLVKPCDGTVEVVEASVFADAASGVSVSVGLIPDYDSTKTRTASVSIAAAGSEARVMRRVDGAQMGEARAMQVSIGDASAVASQWTLHALQVRTKRGATR
ncbi:MAG TPA: hypothetical protein VFY71_07410, partial [Planctomycetota bacterium]|nr:hypothetical protein [Planctomycetota bacterium]